MPRPPNQRNNETWSQAATVFTGGPPFVQKPVAFVVAVGVGALWVCLLPSPLHVRVLLLGIVAVVCHFWPQPLIALHPRGLVTSRVTIPYHQIVFVKEQIWGRWCRLAIHWRPEAGFEQKANLPLVPTSAGLRDALAPWLTSAAYIRSQWVARRPDSGDLGPRSWHSQMGFCSPIREPWIAVMRDDTHNRVWLTTVVICWLFFLAVSAACFGARDGAFLIGSDPEPRIWLWGLASLCWLEISLAREFIRTRSVCRRQPNRRWIAEAGVVILLVTIWLMLAVFPHSVMLTTVLREGPALITATVCLLLVDLAVRVVFKGGVVSRALAVALCVAASLVFGLLAPAAPNLRPLQAARPNQEHAEVARPGDRTAEPVIDIDNEGGIRHSPTPRALDAALRASPTPSGSSQTHCQSASEPVGL